MIVKSLLVSVALIGAVSAQAGAVFTDNTFAAGSYTTAFAASSGTATFSNGTCASCGNPGSALHLTITASDGSNFGGAVINSLFTYDPATQGAITSISASVSKNFSVIAPALFGYGNTFRPVIEQGGNFFTAVLFGPTVQVPVGATSATSGYNSFVLTGLTANDFSQFDTTTGLIGSAHPDFAGSAITFGIGQVLAASPPSAGQSISVTSDFDNLRFLVFSAAVPEPATWAMMLTGFGIAGLSLRRRGAVAA